MSETSLVVAYASVYGHTEKVAHRIAEVARAESIYADVVPVSSIPKDFELATYDAAVIAAPVYYGRHRRDMERFVNRHFAALCLVPSALVSVSMAMTGDVSVAEGYVHDLVRRTGWLPQTFTLIGGAESFTKYGLFTRWIMRRTARKYGRSSDGDYEYTDWDSVDRFTREFVRQHVRRPVPAGV